jgi:hypothetical protein
MNRKMLGIFVSLLAVAMLTTPLVSAKPTSAANNSKAVSFMWHSENGGSTPMEVMTNPPWAEGDEVIVTHTYAVWALNPLGNNYIQIGEESATNPPIPIYADTGYEGDLYVQGVATSPDAGALNYRVYDKVMWGEGNYIEIMCLERASYDLSGPIPEFYASGIFSGHGIIDGQKVQVTGIREGSFQAVGFVLECYGTIRFAGKAP